MKSLLIRTIKSGIPVYALSLALLLMCWQFIQYGYHFHSEYRNLFVTSIALLFMGVGVWAGIQWMAGKKQPAITVTAEESSRLAKKDISELLTRLGISKREYDVLKLIAEGYTNQEIGEKLFISLSSVKTYSTRLFQKLGAERRTQAILLAKKAGLIE